MTASILQDVINAMREITIKTPPVIFTSPYWNGTCLRVEETGDIAVGENAIQMLRLMSDENRAETADPRTFAHTFSGLEIVNAHDVISNMDHPLFERIKPLAGSLFKAAIASMESTKTSKA